MPLRQSMSAEPVAHDEVTLSNNRMKEAVMATPIELHSLRTTETHTLWEAVAGRVLLPSGATSLRVVRDRDTAAADAIELTFHVGDGPRIHGAPVPVSLPNKLLRRTVRTVHLASLRPGETPATLDVSVELVAPLRPGRVVARGHIVGRDDRVTRIEASLHDATGAIVATATARAVRVSAVEIAAAA
jgi:hypothetical protein